MISNQKLFIRGIFENFSDIGKSKTNKMPGGEIDTLSMQDTTQGDDTEQLYSIYKKISAVSFSLKMTDDIEIIMQNECEDDKSATDLKNRFEAVIALAKLSNTFAKKPSPVVKILDKVEMDVFGKTTLLDAKLEDQDIKDIRNAKIF
jgi:hypothetical protein